MALFVLVGVLLQVVAALGVLALALPLLVGLARLAVDVFVVVTRHLVLLDREVAVLTLVEVAVGFAVVELLRLHEVYYDGVLKGLFEYFVVHDQDFAVWEEHHAVRVDSLSG